MGKLFREKTRRPLKASVYLEIRDLHKPLKKTHPPLVLIILHIYTTLPPGNKLQAPGPYLSTSMAMEQIDPEENFYSDLDGLTKAIGEGKYPSPPARNLSFFSKESPQTKQLSNL